MGGFMSSGIPFLQAFTMKDKIGSAFSIIPEALGDKKKQAEGGTLPSSNDRPQTKIKKLLE